LVHNRETASPISTRDGASPPKTGPKDRFGTSPTSYDWLFFDPAIKEVKPGPTVEIIDKNFAPHLEKVKKLEVESDSTFERSHMQLSMTVLER
jgi:hypothetical protein